MIYSWKIMVAVWSSKKFTMVLDNFPSYKPPFPGYKPSFFMGLPSLPCEKSLHDDLDDAWVCLK